MAHILLILLIAIVATSALTRISFTMNPSIQLASSIEALPTATAYEDFSTTGTLVFYPNNVGPVPYLFYQDSRAHTVAKALTFPDMPPANFSSWTGAQIRVTGHVVAEHIIVTAIEFLSGP